jgi:hypothetical protein
MMPPPRISPSDPRLMNTASSTPNGSAESSATAKQRRSREEMEALAKNFVGTPTEELPPAKSTARLAMMGGGAAALVVVLAVVFWPKAGKDEAATRAQAEGSRASAEAEQYRQRFEAERERKRQELASGKDYLERMAAADAALMKDLSDSAGALADRAARAPAPAASDQPPTPRDASAKPAPAKAAPTPAPAQTTPTQAATTTASAAPAKTAPAPAAETPKTEPAKTAPQEVAQVDKSECSIHVSELSKSGKLTYADVKRMKGARIDEDTGNVFTPPVQTGGRTVIFEVFPTGCVQLVRSNLGR